LSLDATPVLGIRQEDLIEKSVDRSIVESDRARHDAWLTRRNSVITESSSPSLRVYRATDLVGERSIDPASAERALLTALPLHEIPVERAATAAKGRRPGGARFGTLVHAILASVPLGASEAEVTRAARLHARTLGAPPEEESSARAAVDHALSHPVLRRAAAADPAFVRREAAVALCLEETVVVDGSIDLLFLEDGEWTVVDFKTDREIERAAEVYERQVALYALGVMRATGQKARGVLLRV
jgi:ATP-dependent exoDNAse (exonuclease V) beta subunit